MTAPNTQNSALFAEIHELVMACLEGAATPRQAEQLDNLVHSNPEARRLYVQYLSDSICLRYTVAPPNEADIGGTRLPVGAEGAPDVASSTHPFLPSPSLAPLHTFSGAAGYFTSGWPVAYLIATVVFAVGLVVAAITHVSQPTQVAPSLPSPVHGGHRGVGGAGREGGRSPLPSSVVARITGLVDCEWEDQVGWVKRSAAPPSSTANHPSEITNQKSLVCLGDRLALRSGLLEITYDTGARVILQGPVTYEIESRASGFLSLGKLTAKLEKRSEVRGQKSESTNQKSEIPTQTFSIRTPTATVTDLGTEFGVEVGKNGDTTSHVFRGSVEVRTISADETVPKVRVLRANESARVESGDGARHERTILLIPGAKSADFVRVLPQRTLKTLDLADVVAGGDGFSGNRNRGIDPTTGRQVGGRLQQKALVGDGRYHPVEGLPFVDGVFIPHGRRPVQTDSAGHTFDAFGNAFQETWESVWAGGAIPVNAGGQVSPTLLGGVDYGAPGHGQLYMHANKGVTFDLEAIRRANPGYKLVRFRTVVGNTETAASAFFYGDAGGKQVLFSDDFQSTAVGATPDTIVGGVDPATGSRIVGAWDLRDGADATVRNDVTPGNPKNGTGANRYLAFTRQSADDQGFVLANGWAASSTEEQIVQLNLSIYVPSGPATDAFGIAAFTNGLDGSGRTISVVQYRNGDVKFHDGQEWKATTLTGKTDVWQHLVITADMAAKKYSINLEGRVFNDAYWEGGATAIGCLWMARTTGTVGGMAFLDNLRLQTIRPSTSQGSSPASASADAWVLVDGERRFGRRGLTRENGAVSIVVPVAGKDRFLTLVTTDGGNGLYRDSILFGDPRLELVPTTEVKQ